MPLISVITPVRNGGRFLKPAIQAIIQQTFQDFEILIVDDQSTDETPRIIDELQLVDSRVRRFKGPGIGTAAACNVAIVEAKGKYLAKVDADDWTVKDRFEKQIVFMEANPEYVVVGGQCELIDAWDRPLGPIRLPTTHQDIDAMLLAGRGSAILHPCAMFHTDAVKMVGMYDESLFLAEDHDIFLKLAEVGRVGNLPDTLVHFRKHTTSTTSLEPLNKSVQRTAVVIARALKRRGLPHASLTLPCPYRPETLESLYLHWALRSIRYGHLSTGIRYGLKAFAEATLHPSRAFGELKRGIFCRKDFNFRFEWDEVNSVKIIGS